MSEENTITRLKKYDEPVIICQHLLMNRYLKLNFPSDIDDDDLFWCDECEKMLNKEGDWTDKALNFANFYKYCRVCFAEMRIFHQKRIDKKTMMPQNHKQ